jgi:hypothetical protein
MLGQEQHAFLALLTLLLAGIPADPPPERQEQILDLMGVGAWRLAKGW